MPQLSRLVLARDHLQNLLDVLTAQGYDVIGPTCRDGAIVLARIASVSDLPEGLTDRQEAAAYRVAPRADKALFGYVVGPNSWKQFLHTSVRSLWQADRAGARLSLLPQKDTPPKYAFFGVRPCDLHAITLLDKALLEGDYPDAAYKRRRDGTLIIAVNCGQAGGACFCTSMNTGPKAADGYDLALTEILTGDHRFLIEVGTERGAAIMAKVPHNEATQADLKAADRISENAAQNMGREIEMGGLKTALYDKAGDAHWEEIAARCLACGNCTMSCPTCFCTTVHDTTDLTTTRAERTQLWDSCFSLDFSYIHGGSVRQSVMSRYRQWMTHKLAAWDDQFGAPGCVGCGRCIVWCPVGIDITDEAKAFRLHEINIQGGNR